MHFRGDKYRYWIDA